MTAPNARLATYFISHGGGPWPWMQDRTNGAYARLEASLRQIPQDLGRTPAAVLVISGHWEESEFTVMTTARPAMIYDYYGFPQHTYQIQYPAPGSPPVAERARRLLSDAGIAARVDDSRGFDHGTFSPLAVIYPEAGVPVLQLSLKHGYDPRSHLDAGRALAPLRDEDVLIVGSGLSYHNLREFGPQARQPSAEFDQWLDRTLVHCAPGEREARLLAWAAAPSARAAHPREDHLLPLMVAVGAADQERATRVYHEDAFMGGISVSSFRFG